MKSIGERQALGFRSALLISMLMVVPTLWQPGKAVLIFFGTRVCGSCSLERVQAVKLTIWLSKVREPIVRLLQVGETLAKVPSTVLSLGD